MPPTCDRCKREWYSFIVVRGERLCPRCHAAGTPGMPLPAARRFTGVRLLREVPESPYPMQPYPWAEAEHGATSPGQEPVFVVGKLRPWSSDDGEYILYADGDLMIGEVVQS